MLRLFLGSGAAAAAAAAPSARFEAPVLVGSSNASAPGGTRFWFPSLSVATGRPGHVAQHITLSGDGGLCPPPGRPAQACDQVMLTRDGGRSYTLAEKVAKVGGPLGSAELRARPAPARRPRLGVLLRLVRIPIRTSLIELNEARDPGSPCAI